MSHITNGANTWWPPLGDTMPEKLSITEFLLARIAEDERAAQAAVGDGRRWFVDGPIRDSNLWWVVGAFIKFPERAAAKHIARHDPARILAECAAKRELVDGWHDEHGGGHVLKTLASVYSDHPDYQQKWKL